jgi:hypothetical protein
MIYQAKKMTTVLIMTAYMFGGFVIQAWAQPSLTPMFGKAFADKNGASAIRMGLGFNQLYKNRWGLYYTYEYRSNVMFFENTPYNKNEYCRDLMGITCKVHPNFTVYGGVGMFMDGIMDDIRNGRSLLNLANFNSPLRKELGILLQPNFTPIQISAGYSINVGFTANLNWQIPLDSDTKSVHLALIDE